jgi:hypothetical protein
MPAFSQQIYKLGINPVVDPPNDALAVIFAQAGRTAGPIPVRGLINGAEFMQTLVKYAGKWRLYVNGEMLEASGLNVGDTASIEIEYDPRPRRFPVPAGLRRALARDPEARAAWDALTPSRRTEIVRYLTSLKTEASVSKNIEKVVRMLTAK